jgi:hypothetical protein
MFFGPAGSIIICTDPDPARYTFQLEGIWIKTVWQLKYKKSLYLERHFLVMPKNQVKMKNKFFSNQTKRNCTIVNRQGANSIGKELSEFWTSILCRKRLVLYCCSSFLDPSPFPASCYTEKRTTRERKECM